MKIRFHKNLIALFSSTLVSTLLTILTSILLARCLSVEDRGAFQFFTVLISYVTVLSFGGLGFSIALSMRNKEYKNWIVYLFVSIVFSILISYIAFSLVEVSFLYSIFIINVIFFGIVMVATEKSKIEVDLKFYRLIALFQTTISLFLYVFFLLWNKELSLNSVIYIYTIISFLVFSCSIIYLYLINKKTVINNKIQNNFFLKNWFKQNMLQSFGATVTNIDKFLIMMFLGEYILGLYAIGLAFDMLIGKFLNVLADYYYSGILNKIDRLKEIIILVVISVLMSLSIIPIFSDLIIEITFGAKYLQISEYLIWFVINSILAGLSWILSQNMLILGKQVLLVTRQVISLLVFVLVFYFFKHSELDGLIIALLSATMVRLAMSIFYFYKYPVEK